MLSIEHPEVMGALQEAGPGLWPLKDAFSTFRVLAIKANADFILAAKLRNEIKFHFYWLEFDRKLTFGIITAAYDQPELPCIISTVAYDNAMRGDIVELFRRETLAIHLFDHQNAELFGGIWKLSADSNLQTFFAQSKKCVIELNAENVSEYYQALFQQFSDPENDGIVLVASLIESQVPEGVVVLQLKEESVNGGGAVGLGIIRSQLEIEKTPGELNEQDISSLISKSYGADRTYLNPGIMEGKEFCDVLAVGKHEVIVVQAKALQRTSKRIEETRTKREGRIDKCFASALAQVRGAERAFYKLGRDVFSSGEKIVISPKTHLLFHLIIIPDKISSLLEKWSNSIADIDTTTTPIVVLDMSEFVNMSNMYRDKEAFLRALMTILEAYEKQGKKIGTYSFYKNRLAVTAH